MSTNLGRLGIAGTACDSGLPYSTSNGETPQPKRIGRVINSAIYIACIVTLGCLTVTAAMAHWSLPDPLRFGVFFLIAGIGSSMKVKIPALKGTMSIGFLFVLVGIMELSLPEVMAIAVVSTITQCTWRVKKKPRFIQILFNVACMCLAVTTTDAVYHSRELHALGVGPVPLLALAACTQFMANTFPIATVIALQEGKSFRKVWRDCHFWSFPYYLVGALVAGGFTVLSHRFGWQVALVSLPAAYVIYRSYRHYLTRLEDEKEHVEEMATLHFRTIEALALAIDAKDATTHDHVRRVQTYAVEIGKELGLDETELNALRAAAVLHDIGKLAVPEHIISKPGKLTLEEFEKMKIHPIVGAEILEQVEFPYPVAPIVRAHHEKWDGSGYPYGLKGEQIPIGARILAAVDCLDALASDRQYRRAMPLDEAMAFVARESGRSFDPKIVELLHCRYRSLEGKAQSVIIERPKLSTDMRIQNGVKPDAGFEASNPRAIGPDFLSSIAAATHEAQALFEMSQTLGNSLSLNETLSVFAMRLNRIVPHDALAIFLIEGERLVPQHVSGEDIRLFSSLRIAVGQGLSGWVAQNNKAILNGNPSVEPGYMDDPVRFSTLRAALSVPLEGMHGMIGVMSLYHRSRDAFSKDHLRVLLALSSKVGLSIENALKYQQAESSATTDYLTGLPNARSLFVELDGELARSRRTNRLLSVIVCDLDGFKQVNDRFGHLEGNRLLQQIAQALSDSCREYDYVARMGGDEFVLVLPDFPQEMVDDKIRQIDQIVAAIGKAQGSEHLGVSAGAASYPADGNDAEDLLSEADRRMYIVKQGRKADRTRRDFNFLSRALGDAAAPETRVASKRVN